MPVDLSVCLYVKVLQLHAVDCDEGGNAEIRYSVDKPSYFAVIRVNIRVRRVNIRARRTNIRVRYACLSVCKGATVTRGRLR